MRGIGVTHTLNLKTGTDTGAENVSPVEIYRNPGKLTSSKKKCILIIHMIEKINQSDTRVTQNPRCLHQQLFSQKTCFDVRPKYYHWCKTDAGLSIMGFQPWSLGNSHLSDSPCRGGQSQAHVIGRPQSRTGLNWPSKEECCPIYWAASISDGEDSFLKYLLVNFVKFYVFEPFRYIWSLL